MSKIFIQNKPLFLVSEVNEKINAQLQQPETIFMKELTAANIGTMLKEMESDSIQTGIFQHADPSELLESFKAHLTLIQAAGGLVYTPNHEILLIFRKGKWDLPKGKLEEHEQLEICALREIEEETGVGNTKILRPLTVTYHTYYEKGKHILKESHWFLVEANEASHLNPQTEEDIERCEWVAANNLSDYTNNMHASIIDVVNKGMKRISPIG